MNLKIKYLYLIMKNNRRACFSTGVFPLGSDVEVDVTNQKLFLLESPTK